MISQFFDFPEWGRSKVIFAYLIWCEFDKKKFVENLNSISLRVSDFAIVFGCFFVLENRRFILNLKKLLVLLGVVQLHIAKLLDPYW